MSMLSLISDFCVCFANYFTGRFFFERTGYWIGAALTFSNGVFIFSIELLLVFPARAKSV
jgi:hypothetical protein